MSECIRVFINGFGRIGRTILRQTLQRDTVEVVGINDVAGLETCAYLLKYDSVYGPLSVPVSAGEASMAVGGREIPFHSVRDLREIDLTGVDVVLDCTGKANTTEFASAGLDAGARNVLISGPSAVAEQTVVLGANDDALGNARIVSNSSCTTNAVSPLLKRLDDLIGVKQAHITTIHCYTGSQPTVDQAMGPLERSRAAAVSMVPTTTSAAKQVAAVLPELHDALSICAVRVPSISVSAIDAVIQFDREVDRPLNELLTEMFSGSSLVGLCPDPCVSTDFRGRSESLIVALTETVQLNASSARIFGWYDNEWGFSARMLDMTHRMAQR